MSDKENNELKEVAKEVQERLDELRALSNRKLKKEYKEVSKLLKITQRGSMLWEATFNLKVLIEQVKQEKDIK